MTRRTCSGSLVAAAAVPLAALAVAGCGGGTGGGWFTVSSAGNMVSGTAPNAGGANGY